MEYSIGGSRMHSIRYSICYSIGYIQGMQGYQGYSIRYSIGYSRCILRCVYGICNGY